MGLNYSLIKYANSAERLAGCTLKDFFENEEESLRIWNKSASGAAYNQAEQAWEFDGTNGYIETKNPLQIAEKGSFVFQFSTIQTGTVSLFEMSDDSSCGFDAIMANGAIRFYNYSSFQIITLCAGGVGNTGDIIQVAVRIDGNSFSSNVKNLTTGASTTVNTTLTAPYAGWGCDKWKIGESTGGVTSFVGKFYMAVAFREYILDTAEILQDYTEIFSNLENNIIGKWLMREQDNYSTYTKDTSGEGNNLTKNGTLDKFEGKRGYELDSATVDYLSGSISGLTDFSLILLLQNTKIGSTGELFYLTTPATSVDIADDGTITNGCGGDFYANRELSGDGKMENQFWIFGLLGATWGGSDFAIGGKMEGGILGAILYDGALSPLQYFYFLAELFFNRGCN